MSEQHDDHANRQGSPPPGKNKRTATTHTAEIKHFRITVSTMSLSTGLSLWVQTFSTRGMPWAASSSFCENAHSPFWLLVSLVYNSYLPDSSDENIRVEFISWRLITQFLERVRNFFRVLNRWMRDVWCELALRSLNSYGVQAHLRTFTTRIKLLDDYIPAVISRRLRERIKNNFRLTLTFGKRLFPLRIADETHVPWYTSSCFSISLNN